MDYKKAAEELFEVLVTCTGLVEDIDIFNWLNDKYPELMDNYVKKIEKEIKNVELPQITPEEEEAVYQRLFSKLKESEAEYLKQKKEPV